MDQVSLMCPRKECLEIRYVPKKDSFEHPGCHKRLEARNSLLSLETESFLNLLILGKHLRMVYVTIAVEPR